MTSWYDLPAEERGAYMDRAEEASGQSFYDLPAEERGYWMEKAEEEVGGFDE